MRETMRPRCAGSVKYSIHHVSPHLGYTIILPGGIVKYACDTDCARLVLDEQERSVLDDRPRLRRVR
jgi:hypothetical protein